MARKKSREREFIENIEIIDIAAEGKAIAKVDNLVIFIPFVVPGDIVDVEIIKKKKNYAEARAIKFHKYSPNRIETKCPHFGICGGCKWQMLDYKYQLEAKGQQVLDNLSRIGHIDISGAQPIIGSDKIYYYRNKLEFTFSTKRWFTEEEIKTLEENSPRQGFGFHIQGFFDKVIDIKYCALQREPSNQI
ncbi:MAG: TRAM domain-containing protein, partial [Bacteroidales bacterium]|nr:TRAM domain-containing protein [Bacteroidales bacterium]